VLDVRVYRAALAPALIALFVAAFSLADRPAAVTTPFAPAGFDGGRAYTLLGELGEAYPNRAPGSATDRALVQHARAIGETPEGLLTEVEGTAFRTGEHRFFLDPRDPLGTGFVLR